MALSAVEVLAALSRVGLTGEVQPTGNPDYQRVYIKCPEGITLGRACIHKGWYSHVKWFVGMNSLDSQWSYYIYAWQYLLRTDKVLSRCRWHDALRDAHEMAVAERNRKIIWRREHPLPTRADGTTRNRAKLAPANPGRYIWQILIAESDGSGNI